MARKRRVRWSRLATRDLDQDHAYLKARDPKAAQAFAARIFAALAALAQNPEMGPVARDLAPLGRYRHFPSERHRIIYRVDDREIVIVRIWDSRRDPGQLLPET